MMDLHYTRQQIDAYLDAEMSEDEREHFLAHYDECQTCRAQVEARSDFVRIVRAAKPDFRASADLRRTVANTLGEAASPQPQPLRSLSWKDFLFPSRWPLSLRPGLGYAGVLIFLISAGFALHLFQRQTQAHQLIETAVNTHERRLAGTVPIEFKSASARDVTHWCNARLHFAFRLPSYQDDSGDRSKYQLVGASRLPFRGKDAAYIAYQLGTERISLIVVSDDQAIASGGEITRAQSLVFHSVRRNGLQVFTWTVHGLTYALVSHVDLPPKQSCVVCHADPKDRRVQQSTLVHRVHSRNGDRVLAEGFPTIAPQR